MPRIDDIAKKEKPIFKKKPYRPWNVLGEDIISIDSEHVKNSGIISNQLINNNESINNQLTNNNDTDSNLFHNDLANDCETVGNPISKQESQLLNKPLTNNITNHLLDYDQTLLQIKRLTGLQKTLLLFIVDNCIYKDSLLSDPFTTSDLQAISNANGDVVNTTIQRLAQKGLIQRADYKTGKGGFRTFVITDLLKKAIMDNKRLTFGINNHLVNDTTNKNLNDLTNDYKTKNPYNNSNNKNIIIDLPDDWKKINFESLQELNFSLLQIKQLYELNVTTPEVIQDSINQFSYTLTHNLSSLDNYPNKLSALMAVLRRGQAWIESNYVSPKVQAARELLERRQKEEDELKNIEQALFKLESEKWLEGLTEQQIKAITPRYNPEQGIGNGIVRGILVDHFKQHEWPNRKGY